MISKRLLVFVLVCMLVPIVSAAPPVAVDDVYTTYLIDEEFVGLEAPGVLINDYDPDGDSIQAEIVDGDAWLSPDGSFFVMYPWRRDNWFRYRVTDGNEYSNVASVIITNCKEPWCEDDYFTTTINQKIEINSLYNNDHWLQLYELGVITPPSHGSLTPTYPGSFDFIYTPDTNWCGQDSFVYRISDGVDWSRIDGVVHINVVNPNPVPEFPSTLIPLFFIIGLFGLISIIKKYL